MAFDADALVMRRVSGRRVPVAHLLLLAVAVSAVGCGYGRDGENNVYQSHAADFHQAMDAFPAGKAVYWLGPRASGFWLQSVGPSSSSAPAVTVYYQSRSALLWLLTYRAPTRPDHGGDPANLLTVDASVHTTTGQLVVLAHAPARRARRPACWSS